MPIYLSSSHSLHTIKCTFDIFYLSGHTFRMYEHMRADNINHLHSSMYSLEIHPRSQHVCQAQIHRFVRIVVVMRRNIRWTFQQILYKKSSNWNKYMTCLNETSSFYWYQGLKYYLCIIWFKIYTNYISEIPRETVNVPHRLRTRFYDYIVFTLSYASMFPTFRTVVRNS